MQRTIVLAWALFGVTAMLRAQSQELPSAPALKLNVPDRPLYTSPADKPITSAGAASKQDEYCFAKVERAFAERHGTVSPAVQGQLRNYSRNVYSEIFSDWSQHMTLAEKNAWGKGKKVAIRFVIHADGSYDMPEMTVSSGRDRYDEHAMEAIRSHTAFPPLPPGVPSIRFCVIVGFHLDPDDGDRTGWIDEANKKSQP